LCGNIWIQWDLAALVDVAAKLVAGISAITISAAIPNNEQKTFFKILLLVNNVYGIMFVTESMAHRWSHALFLHLNIM
jgi:hypothetical protein